MVDAVPHFFSPSGSNRMTLLAVLDAITAFIRQNPSSRYKVIIGSDSSVYGREPFRTGVITVVIVWRIGLGAIYFWTKSEPKMFFTRHDRIIAETVSSVMLAQEVRSRLRDTLGHNFLWDGNEIHADIGDGGESRVFIREVVGLIKGFDFVPVIKPEAWCASAVADRHT